MWYRWSNITFVFNYSTVVSIVYQKQYVRLKICALRTVMQKYTQREKPSSPLLEADACQKFN